MTAIETSAPATRDTMPKAATPGRELHVVEVEWNLYARVVEELESDEPNPKLIGQRLAEALTVDELRDVARLLLPAYVRDVASKQRRDVARLGVSSPRSKKWEQAAAAHRSGELAFLRHRVTPHSGDAKFFGDCTVEEVAALVDQRAKQAKHLMAWAKRYDKVLATMKQRKVATVAELPPADLQRLEGLFDGS